MRNGADVWLRRLLDQLGFGQYFLLPALTVSLLLAWHHTTHERWRLSREVLLGMYVESSLLASCCWASAICSAVRLSHLSDRDARRRADCLRRPGRTSSSWDWVARLIGFCGAGIYEEVLFRLDPGAGRRLGVAALLAFSGTLRIGDRSGRDQRAVFGGPLRRCARRSVRVVQLLVPLSGRRFFALLFVYRGFGIAAGTHALYDIFVGVV